MRIGLLILFLWLTATAVRAELRVSASDALKAATTKPQPEYSAVARQMKVSGKAEIEMTIGADGTVESVRAVSGNPLLTHSAIAAVTKWKFTPFQEDGQPAKATAVLSFDFKP